jgi:hypothetical protein
VYFNEHSDTTLFFFTFLGKVAMVLNFAHILKLFESAVSTSKS